MEIIWKITESAEPYHQADSAFMPFWFAPSVYVARLVAGEFDQRLVNMLPDFSSWKSTALVASYCDVGHMDALLSGAYPPDWEKLMKAFRSQPGRELFCETHECYRKIVEKAIKKRYSAAIRDIQAAYELYPQGRKEGRKEDVARIQMSCVLWYVGFNE